MIMRCDAIWVWNPRMETWVEFYWYPGGSNDVRKLYGLVAYNGCKSIGPPDDAPPKEVQDQVAAQWKEAQQWPEPTPCSNS